MSPEGNKQALEDDRVESLRLLLERQQQRAISYEEALDVGETLVNFFELLAENEADTYGTTN